MIEHINANDLKIGDWVYYGQSRAEIVSINSTSVKLKLSSGREVYTNKRPFPKAFPVEQKIIKTRVRLNDIIVPETQEQKVYLITTEKLFPTKVGIAQNPRDRLCNLQIGNWEKLILYSCFCTGAIAAFRVEKAIHKDWKHLHLRGEWFEVDCEVLHKYITERLQII